MARKRNNSGNDEDFSIFNSDDSIDKQAKAWEKAGKDISDHITSHFESRLKRIEANLRKEFEASNNNTNNSNNNERNQNRQGQREYKSLIEKALENRANHNEKYNKRHGDDSGASMWQKAAANIINQSGKGQKFDPDAKIGTIIGKEIVKGLENAFSTYIAKPLSNGISNMYSAYEANMSEIAGRMGMDRHETTSLMHQAIKELNSLPAKNAISANKELIPELRSVSSRGWQGNEAVKTAITNSIDKKIMPWMDSSTEAWNNIQFNLNENQLKTLKSQELLLQESQSGNRLLQSGVINSLTNDLQPLLTNIDYNTMSEEKLGPELKALMENYVDNGYTPQEAYAEAQKLMQVYKDPTAGFSKGDAYSVFQATTASQGGSISDIAESTAGLDKWLGSLGLMGSGLASSVLGAEAPRGINRPEYFSQRGEIVGNTDWDKYKNADSSIYDEAANSASEKVTATQAYDNAFENSVSGTFLYVSNNLPHMNDTLDNIFKVITGIASGVLLSKIGGMVLKKVAPSLLSKAGGKVAGEAAKTLGKGLAEEAATAGAQSAAQAAAGTAGASTLSTAAGIAIPLAAGGVAAYKGISSGIEDLKGEHKARGLLSTMGGVAAGVGGVALANAWNPVGWGLLIGGGLTVIATQLHKAYGDVTKSTSNAAKSLTAQWEKIEKSNKDGVLELNKHNAKLSKQYDEASDINEKRSIVVEAGLASEAKARKLNEKQLDSLTKAYLKASKNFSKDQKNATGAVKKEESKLADEAAKDIYNTLNDNVDKIRKNEKTEWNDISKDSEGGEAVGTLVDALKSQYTEAHNAGRITDTQFDDAIKKLNNANEKGSWDEEDVQSALRTAYEKDFSSEDWSAVNESMYGMDGKTSKNKTKFDFYSETGAKTSDKILSDEQKAELNGLISQLSNPAKQTKYNEGSKEDKKAVKESITKLLEKNKDIIAKNRGSWDSINDLSKKYDIDLESIVKPPKYAVGNPLISKDQFALLHKGEAVIPAEENKARTRSILGLSEPQMSKESASFNSILDKMDSIIEIISGKTKAKKADAESLIQPQSKPMKGLDRDLKPAEPSKQSEFNQYGTLLSNIKESYENGEHKLSKITSQLIKSIIAPITRINDSQVSKDLLDSNNSLVVSLAKKLVSPKTDDKVKPENDNNGNIQINNESDANNNKKQPSVEQLSTGPLISEPLDTSNKMPPINADNPLIASADTDNGRLSQLYTSPDSVIATDKVSSKDIVNAIQSQTEVLKASLNAILQSIPQSGKPSIDMTTHKIKNDRSTLNPQYGNVRPVY